MAFFVIKDVKFTFIRYFSTVSLENSENMKEKVAAGILSH